MSPKPPQSPNSEGEEFPFTDREDFTSDRHVGTRVVAWLPGNIPLPTLDHIHRVAKLRTGEAENIREFFDITRAYLELWRDVVRYQFIYSLASLFLGLCRIIGGSALALWGVTRQSSWKIGCWEREVKLPKPLPAPCFLSSAGSTCS